MFASSPRWVTLLALSLVLVLGWTAPASAQWVEDGVHVSAANMTPFFHQLCTDGEGGVIMARAEPWHVVADRIDAHGRVLWTAGGVDLSSLSGYHGVPDLVSDGEGGAIVAFLRDVSGDTDIWAQRIDADGNLLWGAEGDSICSAPGVQSRLAIVADGMGGAIIVWEDWRGVDADIYAQRIDADGNVQWTADGEAVCAATGDQIVPRIVTDGVNGAIIGWQDDRNGPASMDVFAQHVWSHGGMAWTADGDSLCTAGGPQQELAMISDGGGGAIAAWRDQRSGEYIYAQRVDHYGGLQWTVDGEQLCTTASGAAYPALIPDGTGGAIVAWQDKRSLDGGDIYAQRIDGAGAIQWGASASAICTASGIQSPPRIFTDDAGGAIITWDDQRFTYPDIFVQRVDPGGAVVWTADGAPLSTATYRQEDPEIAGDGEGGAIVVWRDYRDQTTRVYAQRIERNGYWGYPSATIFTCNDVPGDQGGLVNLAWYASRLDPWPEMAISHYTLWRAIESAPGAPAVLPNGAQLLGPREVTRDLEGPVYRYEPLGSAIYFWELVDTQDAYNLASYSKTIPTLFDSTDVTNRYHYFQVMAHGNNPGEFWISPPDSARSVDNLAPAAPQGLAGMLLFDPDGIDLIWFANSEEDLSHYAVYRGLAPDFTADAGSFVTDTEDTTLFDPDGIGDLFYYKLFAVDVHGNESPFALLAPTAVTGVDDERTSAVTRLAQNSPNPFTAAGTRIAFSLREADEVRLRVYDAGGRLVRVLADGFRPAGPQEIAWDGRDARGESVASGVYYYRLDTGDFMRTRRMVLLR